MGFYEREIFGRLCEWGLERPVVQRIRRRVLAPASGRILEIGLGTGGNLAAYPDSVRELCSVAPAADLDRRARSRAREAGIALEHVRGDVHRLPFAEASFDTVVATFVLCTVADTQRALAEMARVLAPEGQYLFLEHIVARPGIGRWMQRAADPLTRRINLGCSLLRDLAPEIEERFDIDHLVEDHVSGMPPLYRRVIFGRALP